VGGDSAQEKRLAASVLNEAPGNNAVAHGRVVGGIQEP